MRVVHYVISVVAAASVNQSPPPLSDDWYPRDRWARKLPLLVHTHARAVSCVHYASSSCLSTLSLFTRTDYGRIIRPFSLPCTHLTSPAKYWRSSFCFNHVCLTFLTLSLRGVFETVLTPNHVLDIPTATPSHTPHARKINYAFACLETTSRRSMLTISFLLSGLWSVVYK